jgi:hypothetical protein
MKWETAAAVAVLTALSFFVFPGHTILQSDTQIYIPILERLADPTVLKRDIVAVRPHVAFTLYDETALVLRRVTGLSFEQVLLGQQLLYRAAGILGLIWIASSAGLSSPLTYVVATVMSLGANVMGPAVMVVELEPVPRGFSLPLVLLSWGLLARGRAKLAAAACAAAALAFHPPTAIGYFCIAGVMVVAGRDWRAAAVLSAGPVLLLFSIWTHPASPESPSLLGVIPTELEAMQRLRASYNWVGLWAEKWLAWYLLVFLVACGAWFRVRRNLSRPVSVVMVALTVSGMLSVPVSYLLLDRLKLAFAAQFQPARYLLFVVMVAMMLTTIAAAHAVMKRRYMEAAGFFVLPLILASTEWDLSNLTLSRIAFLAAVAALLTAAAATHRYTAIGAAALFFVVPYAGGLKGPPLLHTPDLDQLSRWARESIPKDAVFQFARVGRRLEPGVFRARALRAIFVDWKGGGQSNFLPEFSRDWMDRWKRVNAPLTLDAYRQLGVDYVVFVARNKPAGIQPVFENASWAVYDTRNLSTSARLGMDAWAPIRVTDSAAAALAKRRESAISRPSDSATANAALKVSPAAVVSRAST